MNDASAASAEIVVITAVFGERDTLKEPAVVTPGCRYVCFTDRDLRSTNWEIVNVTPSAANPRRASRPFKIRPHDFVDAQHSLWVDATFTINVDVREFARRHLARADLAAFRHPDRDCVFEEASICAELLLDDPRILAEQAGRYSRAGLPHHAGLFACGALLRRHSAEVAEFNAAWWDEYVSGSQRDQISFSFCVWKHQLAVEPIPGNIRSSSDLALTPHVPTNPRGNLEALLADEPDPVATEVALRLAQARTHDFSRDPGWS